VSCAVRHRLGTKIILAFVLLSIALPVSAGRWKLRKSFDLRTASTQNLFLTDEDQVNATVLVIRPGLVLSRQGGRARVRLAYAPSANLYLDSASRDRLAHYLAANASAELIKNYFFLRVNARAGQVSTDPLRRTSFNDISNPDALANTFGFSIRPDIRGPLFKAGRYARFRIQPGLNYTYTEDGLKGTAGRATRVNVVSGPAFGRTPWSLNYRNDVFDNDTDDGIGRVDGRIGFLLSNAWRVDFTLGYDSGRYTSSRSTSGFRWRSTVSYRPTSRSDMSLGIGEAFFGDDWIVRFNHRYKHSAWRIRYDRNVENARQEILQYEFVPLRDEFGEPIEDPIADRQLGVFVSSPALIDDVYVRDNLSARWAWGRKRTSASLRLRINRRDYQSLELDETDGRVDLSLSRRFGPRSSGNARLQYWNHSEEATGPNDFEQYGISMRYRYRVSRYLNLGLVYSHTKRTSESAAGEFSDNLLGLDFAFNFNRSL
jgi:uncharacterized protein (PEP-CTERM system associated)